MYSQNEISENSSIKQEYYLVKKNWNPTVSNSRNEPKAYSSIGIIHSRQVPASW
jgi:hypothetical protein